MPAIAAFAVIGADRLNTVWPASGKLRVLSFVGVSLVMCLLFLGEIHLRYRSGANYPVGELWEAMQAPQDREAFSDEMYEAFGRPQNLPVSLAYQEVQIRYWLDDRFVVRSLDGRTDPVLLEFVDESGNYDHIGYIEKRDIDYVMETPNYNRDSEEWSLEELRHLSLGQTYSRNSLTFCRIGCGFTVGRVSVAGADD
jgi:hypothetical protein